MKKIILFATFSVTSAFLPEVVLSSQPKDLAGYIEVFEGCEITRFNFYTHSIQKITKDCKILNYTLAPDGTERLVELSTEHSKIVRNYGTSQEKVIRDGDNILEMSISPDSKKVAYLLWEKSDELFQVNGKVFVMNIDGSGDRKIFDSPAIRSMPSWFPDSRRVAISTFDHEIVIVDTITSQHQKVVDFGTMPSVSPDGKKIAYLSHDVSKDVRRKIIAHDKMNNDEALKALTPAEKRDRDDMTRKYFMSNSIYIYDLYTKRTIKIAEDLGIEEPVLWSKDNKYLAFTDRHNLFGYRDVKLINIQFGKITKLKSPFGGMLKGWIYIDPKKHI